MIRNTAAKVGLFSSASPDQSKKAASEYALVFHKYGDHYFLAGIKLADERTAYWLPPNKAEAELRSQNVTASRRDRARLAAVSHAGDWEGTGISGEIPEPSRGTALPR